MPPTVSELSIPTKERPQTHALDRSASVIDSLIPAKLISMEFYMQAMCVRMSELFFFRNCTKLAQGGNERLNVRLAINTGLG